MNAQEWEKLRKNWGGLLEVYPSSLIIYLYQNDVINSREKSEVEKAGVPHKQMETLLDILKGKPQAKKAFKFLMEALKFDAPELARRIEETATESDPSLTSSVDPHILDDDARKVVHKYFSSKPNMSVAISEIRNFLKSEGVFSGGLEWSNEILKKFICDEFLTVEAQEEKKRSGKTTKKEIYFKNLGRHNFDEINSHPKPETSRRPNRLKEPPRVADVKKLPAKELRKCLQHKFEEMHMSTEPLDILEKEGITGEVFLTLTETDFKEMLPSAGFATYRKLKILVDEYNQTEEPLPSSEYLRDFDTQVKHTDKYVKGRVADVSVNARGKKTTPVKNFHLVDEKDKDKALEFIGSEVVPFVSACLNDRRNGTIYFGISPKDNEQHKTGEIIGVSLLKEEVQAQIKDCLQKSFSSSQKNLIASTVRDAKFLPVTTGKRSPSETELCVIEVDVNPSSSVLGEDTIRTKLAELPIFYKKNKSKAAVFKFSEEGFPKTVSSDEMCTFEKDQPRLLAQRREDEVQKRAEQTPNLRNKLLNLLTGGTETMQDDMFIFLMTSSVDTHMDMPYLLKTVPFIKQLLPEVVFDFDGSGSTDGIYKNLDEFQEEAMRVLTTDNFDKDRLEKDDFKHLTSDLANESRISWVFCNGYEEMSLEPMSPTEWNKRRKKGFQECLKFYTENFEKERILIIICLFSKEYDSMIGACDEVLTQLPDKWIALAETEQSVKLFEDELLHRKIVDKRDLFDRCVVGMPWEQVNSTIIDAKGVGEVHECKLPCSSGALIDVREKKLKDWCDIEVLSASDPQLLESEWRKKSKEVEEKFYKGEQVDWLNFFFNDQVLKRDIHEGLQEIVKDSLNGRGKEEEDKVTVVPIYHQPGAGGTTSAKQILWEMRKEYRCCIVNAITDQTCDQLDDIRRYKEIAPKPLLILIDNEDEEKYLQLKNSLEERGRKRWRQDDETFDVYCTIICCIRRASLPISLTRGRIALRQELFQRELQWFKDKNDNLTQRYRKDRNSNIDPKFLISFNILRENFDKEYVSKVVKEFTDAVVKDEEVQLLKIVSLLNTYDLNCQPIPLSCLDKILEKKTELKRSLHGRGPRPMKWEAILSQSVRVLLNLYSKKNPSGKQRRSIRVFNKIIAQEILRRMKERTEQKESEMMLELMESAIFQSDSFASKQFMTMISNLMKRRKFQEDGIRRLKFSSFVIYVKDQEGAEIAAKVLVQLFELNQDPFTAQLISRFYIDIKNWDLAEEYAKKATQMLPSNSFVWDTYGQVFMNQLKEKMVSEKTLEKADAFKDSEMKELIKLTKKCSEAFRKEQQISELEMTTQEENNFAGYFGELRAILILLSALKMRPSLTNGDVLHRFLVGQASEPKELSFLTEDDLNFLKSLEKSANEAMRRLDEEFLQMKGSSNQEMQLETQLSEFNRKGLLDLKVNFAGYFGEPTASAPEYLGERDRCEYISRYVRHLGAASLHTLLNLRQAGEFQKLFQIFDLLLQNVKLMTFDNLLALVNTVTVLVVDHKKDHLHNLKFQQILQWSKELYQMNSGNQNRRSYLEPYLHFVMYNFPTKERLQSHELCLTADLSNAIIRWHEAFRTNYPKHNQDKIPLRKRETTLFFLGNGLPLKDIVHQDSLVEMEQFSLKDKWELPAVRRQLKLMDGTLTDRGAKVNLVLISKEGNKFPLSIFTSHQVTNRNMWQKRVYFYLGFSFSGPKAFGMSLTELGQGSDPYMPVKSKVYSSSMGSKQSSPENILWKLIENKRKLQNMIVDKRRCPRPDYALIRKKERELTDTLSAIESLIGN